MYSFPIPKYRYKIIGKGAALLSMMFRMQTNVPWQ